MHSLSLVSDSRWHHFIWLYICFPHAVTAPIPVNVQVIQSESYLAATDSDSSESRTSLSLAVEPRPDENKPSNDFADAYKEQAGAIKLPPVLQLRVTGKLQLL